MPLSIMNKPKRGEIWEVQFDQSVGAEIKKNRPAAIMNPQEIDRLPLFIVVPITDWKVEFNYFSWFIYLPFNSDNGLTKDSGADAFQVKSVSERRFIKKLGTLTNNQIEEIAIGIALCVGYSL